MKLDLPDAALGVLKFAQALIVAQALLEQRAIVTGLAG